ncbi:MAG: hypothetical protein AAF628_04160 [Planctomycetota bacterium]
MRALRTLVGLSGLFATLAPGFAQVTHVVSASGGGSFREIRDAIAVANPGDTVVVRAGTYSNFVVDKGIAVIGESGTNVYGFGEIGVEIGPVPAGQTAVVRGITPFGLGGDDLRISNSDGHVHWEGNVRTGGTVRISDCRHVSVHQERAAHAVVVTNSTVLFTSCDFSLVPTRHLVFQPVLQCTDSDVTFAGGTIRGGSTSGVVPPVRLAGGRTTVTGDAQTSIAVAGSAYGPVAAIEVFGGELRLDPNVVVRGTGGAGTVSGPGAVVIEPIPWLRADVAASQLSTLIHAPGALRAHLLLSLSSVPSSTPLGSLWIGSRHVLLDSVSVPPTGSRTVAFTVPATVPLGVPVVLQCLVAQPAGFELSTPVVLTLDGP